MIRSKKRSHRLQDHLFFVVSRNDYRDGRTVIRIIRGVSLAPVLDDRQGTDKQKATNTKNDTDQEKIPNATDDQVYCSECRASRPCLPPEICRDRGHYFVTSFP